MDFLLDMKSIVYANYKQTSSSIKNIYFNVEIYNQNETFDTVYKN